MGNQFFFINYNENTLFWGESFNWGVLAEETPLCRPWSCLDIVMKKIIIKE